MLFSVTFEHRHTVYLFSLLLSVSFHTGRMHAVPEHVRVPFPVDRIVIQRFAEEKCHCPQGRSLEFRLSPPPVGRIVMMPPNPAKGYFFWASGSLFHLKKPGMGKLDPASFSLCHVRPSLPQLMASNSLASPCPSHSLTTATTSQKFPTRSKKLSNDEWSNQSHASLPSPDSSSDPV